MAFRAAQACYITRSTASAYLAFQLGVVGVCLVIIGYANQFVLVVMSLQAVRNFYCTSPRAVCFIQEF